MTTTDTEPIGPLLDAERKAGGVTLKEIAEAVGCSVPMAHHLMKGTKRMSADQLETILAVLRPRYDMRRELGLNGGRRR